MRSHASGEPPEARSPAAWIASRSRARASFGQVLEHDRVHHHGRDARAAASVRRSAIHASASARSTVAGTRRATSMAASRRAKRSTWSGHTYDIRVRRPSGVVASSGLRSHPRRSATSKRRGQVGRVALPHAGEAHRAVGVAAHHPPGVVGEVVPAQVQAGAGADLEDAQRQGGAVGDRRRSRRPARPSDPPRWSARRPRCSRAISASCSSTVARNVARQRRALACRRPTGSGRPAPAPAPRARSGAPRRGSAAPAPSRTDPRRGRRGAAPTRRRRAGRRRPRRARGRTAATPTPRTPRPGTRRRR